MHNLMVLRCVPGSQFMGKDQHGNTYWEIKNPGGKPDPKRQIDYVEKNMVSPPQLLMRVRKERHERVQGCWSRC